ncbi:hypothetical protein [Polaromonas sp. UBA4122]|uniref:hypothetical protein n=1 Tax=Polaromonas sp. UBA4122 TaxID=1947074 RepID=UPI0025E04B03|nr:hypothetical protein [Polaromonas sp. UBA4122]
MTDCSGHDTDIQVLYSEQSLPAPMVSDSHSRDHGKSKNYGYNKAHHSTPALSALQQ